MTNVRLGQVVGYIGNSGTVEAAQNTQDEPHLHFEVWDAEGFMGENLAGRANICSYSTGFW